LIPGKHPSEEIQKKTVKKIMEIIETSKKENHTVVFFDPMHQIHNNENDYCRQFKGKANTKTIGSNSGRRRLNIIGAIDPISFSPTIILSEANYDSDLMTAYLKHLKEIYSTKEKITVILDNASYNRAYKTQNCAKDLGIELFYLPPYSPNLNLIERLWKFFKKKIMKNKYYETFKEFEQKAECFFKNFDQYNKEIKTLLTLNFGIIKTS